MDEKLYIIEKQAHCVRIAFKSGAAIGPDDIIAAIEHENALYPVEDRQSLWDLRGCQVTQDFGFDAMSRVVDLIRSRYTTANTTNKAALVVDGSTVYGLSRMFQMLMDGFPTQIAVFQDEAAARNWIGLKAR
jgi:hypothetical protein